jgi:SAM-dependent methyltransferase
MEPISNVLQPLLPQAGFVLEIASGAGEHITRLARDKDPGLIFQPSDPGAAERASIDAWTKAHELTNVRPAIDIDAASPRWPMDRVDVIFCINMIHISPWTATVGLFENAARLLTSDGLLFTYGPYRRGGAHTSDGNASFDVSLRNRNPQWGIRDVAALSDLATDNGLTAPEIIEMPANNLSLVFRRQQKL